VSLYCVFLLYLIYVYICMHTYIHIYICTYVYIRWKRNIQWEVARIGIITQSVSACESVINAYVPGLKSLRTERTRPRCQRVIFESIHARNVLPPLTHTEMLYLSVWHRTQLFAALSESERVKNEKNELCLHRSNYSVVANVFSAQIRRERNTSSIPFAKLLICYTMNIVHLTLQLLRSVWVIN